MSEDIVLVVASNYGQYEYYLRKEGWNYRKYRYATDTSFWGLNRETTRWIGVGTWGQSEWAIKVANELEKHGYKQAE